MQPSKLHNYASDIIKQNGKGGEKNIFFNPNQGMIEIQPLYVSR